jgi:hypothetical protein
MPLLHLGLPHGGNHPAYSEHLNEDLFGGLSTSGVMYEPFTLDTMMHPLSSSIADQIELTPTTSSSASNLSGRALFGRSCMCCKQYEAWGFAGTTPNAIRGDVFSKRHPNAYAVEASAFSASSLGQDIVNNVTNGVSITNTSLSAGTDPESQVLIEATISGPATYSENLYGNTVRYSGTFPDAIQSSSTSSYVIYDTPSPESVYLDARITFSVPITVNTFYAKYSRATFASYTLREPSGSSLWTITEHYDASIADMQDKAFSTGGIAGVKYAQLVLYRIAPSDFLTLYYFNVT